MVVRLKQSLNQVAATLLLNDDLSVGLERHLSDMLLVRLLYGFLEDFFFNLLERLGFDFGGHERRLIFRLFYDRCVIHILNTI
jgi:hypothetical protein